MRSGEMRPFLAQGAAEVGVAHGEGPSTLSTCITPANAAAHRGCRSRISIQGDTYHMGSGSHELHCRVHDPAMSQLALLGGGWKVPQVVVGGLPILRDRHPWKPACTLEAPRTAAEGVRSDPRSARLTGLPPPRPCPLALQQSAACPLFESTQHPQTDRVNAILHSSARCHTLHVNEM